MSALASLLLALVVMTHYAPAILGSLYADAGAATRAWFYVLRGIEGAALFGLVWALAPRKPAHVRYGIALACAWGMLEESQTAVCRLAVGIERRVTVPIFGGLCDVATGWPVVVITLLLVMAGMALVLDKKMGGRSNG